MNTKLIERIEALLKDEHFTHITKHSSTHSATLSADKGAERLVLHITDKDEPPHQAGVNPKVPAASEFRVTATLAGMHPNPEGQVAERVGQGGALRVSASGVRKLKRR
jgi:hypothetical protein